MKTASCCSGGEYGTLIFVKLVLAFLVATIAACAQEFPSVKDWNTVSIKLERGGCLGTCPVYSVELRGSGEIRFEGQKFVTVPGSHRDTLRREDLEDLVEQFQDAEFFSLKSSYGEAAADVPAVVLTVSVDGRTKSVTNRFGAVPPILGELEQAVEFHGHTVQWVFGEGRTVPGLKREGFDLHSTEAGAMLARAAYHGDVQVVRDLVAAGAPVDVPVREFCEVALTCAAHNHNLEVLQMLIAAGASKADQAMKDLALVRATARGDREMIRLLREYDARE